jgi:hypothetical protein
MQLFFGNHITDAMAAVRTRRFDSAVLALCGEYGGDGLLDELCDVVGRQPTTEQTEAQAEVLAIVTLTAWNLLVCAENEPMDHAMTASEALDLFAALTCEQALACTIDGPTLRVRTLQVESLLHTVQAALS